MNINIKQVTLATFPALVTATVAQVDTSTVALGKNATGAVFLGNIVAVDGDPNRFQACPQGAFTSTLTDEQYAKWGEEDTYAANCFVTNLGLTPA